jgi:hypothetical protein
MVGPLQARGSPLPIRLTWPGNKSIFPLHSIFKNTRTLPQIFRDPLHSNFLGPLPTLVHISIVFLNNTNPPTGGLLNNHLIHDDSTPHKIFRGAHWRGVHSKISPGLVIGSPLTTFILCLLAPLRTSITRRGFPHNLGRIGTTHSLSITTHFQETIVSM